MTPKKAVNIATLSFEEAYQRLEQVISALEAGELDLDRSIALYEEGMQLAEICETKLDDAQLQVTKLLSRAENARADDDDAGGASGSADKTDPPAAAPDGGSSSKDGASRQTSYLTFCS